MAENWDTKHNEDGTDTLQCKFCTFNVLDLPEKAKGQMLSHHDPRKKDTRCPGRTNWPNDNPTPTPQPSPLTPSTEPPGPEEKVLIQSAAYMKRRSDAAQMLFTDEQLRKMSEQQGIPVEWLRQARDVVQRKGPSEQLQQPQSQQPAQTQQVDRIALFMDKMLDFKVQMMMYKAMFQEDRPPEQPKPAGESPEVAALKERLRIMEEKDKKREENEKQEAFLATIDDRLSQSESAIFEKLSPILAKLQPTTPGPGQPPQNQTMTEVVQTLTKEFTDRKEALIAAGKAAGMTETAATATAEAAMQGIKNETIDRLMSGLKDVVPGISNMLQGAFGGQGTLPPPTNPTNPGSQPPTQGQAPAQQGITREQMKARLVAIGLGPTANPAFGDDRCLYVTPRFYQVTKQFADANKIPYTDLGDYLIFGPTASPDMAHPIQQFLELLDDNFDKPNPVPGPTPKPQQAQQPAPEQPPMRTSREPELIGKPKKNRHNRHR